MQRPTFPAILETGVYAIVPFDRFTGADLERRAKKAVPEGTLRKPGGSQERYVSHLAGRAAVAAIFEAAHLPLVVLPDPEWGYLRVFSRDGMERSDVFANISHTRGVAVGVVMNRPVGIDIERAGRSVERVFERMTAPIERENLPATVPTQNGEISAGIFLWSAKEAVSKATGMGIKFGLQHFIIDLKGPRPYSVRLEVSGPLKPRDPAIEARLFQEFVITFCSERAALNRGLMEIPV